MRMPLSFVKDFIDPDLAPSEIAETLTMLGLEVDAIVDDVFEISLTPNLGHCMSALGIARELSAYLQIPLKMPSVSIKTQDAANFDAKKPDFNLSPRYMCRYVEGVQIAPSPSWLQEALLACGLEPICNAVDIANYICFKLGQPLHIFDADALQGKTLEVVAAASPTSFKGLDGIERVVPVGSIFIQDAKGPVALAGILGGENSSVTTATKNIVIEAAVFNPVKIRQTAKKLGLRSESSQRFEKGVDPLGTPYALDMATALIMKECKAQSAYLAIDFKGELSPNIISVRIDRVNRVLGTKLSITEIQNIFERLGFKVQEENEKMLVDVPLFRSDIAEEIDLIEEVIRIFGMNHIEKSQNRSFNSRIPHDPDFLFERKVREHLIGFGLQEFIHSDLISKKLGDLAVEWVRPGASQLVATYAKTEEYSILRTSLLPSFLDAAKTNFNQKNLILAAFEIGRIHYLQEDELIEEPMAAILLSGKNGPLHWEREPKDIDFFDLKGAVENLLESLQLTGFSFVPSKHLSFHPKRQADLFVGEEKIGSMGEIHPALLPDTKQKIFYAEMNLHLLRKAPKKGHQMSPLSPFPSSERDWTIPLDPSTMIQTVFDAINSQKSILLEKVELIDVYTPENGKTKNATFRFTYRDPLKTISFDEVENAHKKMMAKFDALK